MAPYWCSSTSTFKRRRDQRASYTRRAQPLNLAEMPVALKSAFHASREPKSLSMAFRTSAPFFGDPKKGAEVPFDGLQDVGAFLRVAVSAYDFPVDIVEEGPGMIPGEAALELSDDAVVAIGGGPIRRLEAFLDIIQRRYIAL